MCLSRPWLRDKNLPAELGHQKLVAPISWSEGSAPKGRSSAPFARLCNVACPLLYAAFVSHMPPAASMPYSDLVACHSAARCLHQHYSDWGGRHRWQQLGGVCLRARQQLELNADMGTCRPPSPTSRTTSMRPRGPPHCPHGSCACPLLYESVASRPLAQRCLAAPHAVTLHTVFAADQSTKADHMVASIPVQAVVLVGGAGSRLHPLNSAGTPKALLSVGNQALLHYPLRSLEEAGIKDAFLVCSGESHLHQDHAVGHQIIHRQAAYTGAVSGVSYHEVCCRDCIDLTTVLQASWVPDGKDTADALRSVLDSLTSSIIVVVSGDLITDLPLQVSDQHNIEQICAYCGWQSSRCFVLALPISPLLPTSAAPLAGDCRRPLCSGRQRHSAVHPQHQSIRA